MHSVNNLSFDTLVEEGVKRIIDFVWSRGIALEGETVQERARRDWCLEETNPQEGANISQPIVGSEISSGRYKKH